MSSLASSFWLCPQLLFGALNPVPGDLSFCVLLYDSIYVPEPHIAPIESLLLAAYGYYSTTEVSSSHLYSSTRRNAGELHRSKMNHHATLNAKGGEAVAFLRSIAPCLHHRSCMLQAGIHVSLKRKDFFRTSNFLGARNVSRNSTHWKESNASLTSLTRSPLLLLFV